MSKAYFANSGSEANDSAIKMIWYRSNALGMPQKKKLISRYRSYHGVTLGAASLTGLSANHHSFDLPIDRFLHLGCPHFWREGLPGESEQDFATRMAAELEALIVREGPDTIAAFFAEPLMGAGGVIVPPRTYWAKVQAVLRRYDILLVADEVICGFGRTGRMFGSQTFDIEPDIMVLSKQLSSSYMPISALLINRCVMEPITEESGRVGVFGHGFTAGGHPVAAAVAQESIRIIVERNLVEHAATVGAYMQSRLRELEGHDLVGEVRGVGLIGAIELVTDKAARRGGNPPGQLGLLVNRLMLQRRVMVRNILDTIAFCPPLIVSCEQIDTIMEALRAALDEALSIV
jgi:4-aminobutyrate--pyruvate transaminase